ncbi:hypothetical protein E2C01_015793 [Portunus trituberculatus]|uniref:Uncharacterized protein n=1 Tax=Portunus trituberculatus TaxID=210409 RepID=A0A5B7DNW8_PORTR|nr:hypothetical protein [Portunus trituberculatus]
MVKNVEVHAASYHSSNYTVSEHRLVKPIVVSEKISGNKDSSEVAGQSIVILVTHVCQVEGDKEEKNTTDMPDPNELARESMEIEEVS